MLVALWRHAENYKELVGLQAHNEPDNTTGRPIDPIVTMVGGMNASHVAMSARTSIMQGINNTLILSSDWSRAQITSNAGVSAFGHPAFGPNNSQVTPLNFPALDAKTADEYFSVFHFLQNVAEFCMINNIDQPQAIILITHAHNILSQLLQRFLDRHFADFTPKEVAFLDCILEDFEAGSISFLHHAMANGDYERYKKNLTDPKAGHKPEYSEMRIFDMAQRQHVETILPPWIEYSS